MALRGSLTHRKIRRLAQTLKIDFCFALGLAEALWHVAGEQTPPNGAIGRMADEDIAMEMFYTGDASAMLRAFTDSGLLEEHSQHRLIVHDWADWADDAVDTRLARSGVRYADGRTPRMKKLARQERQTLCALHGWADPSAINPLDATECHEKAFSAEAGSYKARGAAESPEKRSPDPVPDPDPVPEKQKRSRGKREMAENPLHAQVKGLVFAYYRSRNGDRDPAWDAGESAALKRLLSASPNDTLEDWRACLTGRYRSDVNHGDRPRMWLGNLSSYRKPVNTYNRPKEQSSGTRAERTVSSVQATLDAIEREESGLGNWGDGDLPMRRDAPGGRGGSSTHVLPSLA